MPEATSASASAGTIRRSGCHASPTRLTKIAIAVVVAAIVLLTSGGVALALGYGLATVVLGALASWAGIALGAALGSPEGRDRMPVDSDASGDPR